MHQIEFHRKSQRVWRSKSTPPTALVVSGSEGAGMAEFVRDWAKALLCEKPIRDSTICDLEAVLLGCDQCPACLRAVKLKWIDVVEIAPEIHESGRQGKIPVDSLRDLKALQGIRPYLGGYRIVIIHDAHTMTVQAANSVLKLLEEPPQQWLFWMTTTDVRLLLPTILSRCQRLALRPLDDATLLACLDQWNFPTQLRDEALRISKGNVRVLNMMREPSFWESRTLIHHVVQGRKPIGPLLDWCVEDPGHLEQALLVLESWALDHPLAQWFDLAEEVGHARQRLLAPVNRKLTLQYLISQFADRAAQ